MMEPELFERACPKAGGQSNPNPKHRAEVSVCRTMFFPCCRIALCPLFRTFATVWNRPKQLLAASPTT